MCILYHTIIKVSTSKPCTIVYNLFTFTAAHLPCFSVNVYENNAKRKAELKNEEVYL